MRAPSPRSVGACATQSGAGLPGSSERIGIESLKRWSNTCQAGARLAKSTRTGSKLPNARGKSL